jgi:uncharacterized protein GlcG (DUF336 family)
MAVVDPRGDLVASSADDSVPADARSLAFNKAYTAAVLQLATHQLGRGSGPAFQAPDGFAAERLVRVPGGYPLMSGGAVVGAIGVHGAPDPQADLQCCLAALSVLRPATD